MQYALINGVRVANVIVVEEGDEGVAFLAAIAPEWDRIEALDTPHEQGLGVGIGWGWADGAFVAPEALPVPDPSTPAGDPRWWWIDVGPFKDRLGMLAPAIYASNHSACKGVVGMIDGRQYIDLKRPEVSVMMDVMIAAGQPAVDPVWPGSAPLTAAKKAAILTTPTTEAERHIKGL